jgi:hypothetical protein
MVGADAPCSGLQSSAALKAVAIQDRQQTLWFAACNCLQAFPYFYVPYGSDLPSEPSEGGRNAGRLGVISSAKSDQLSYACSN